MTEPAATTEAATAAVDLAHVPGSGGVVWSASPDGCHVNLVVLDPGGAIASHRNDALDVLVVVLDGDATLSIDGAPWPLGPQSAVVVPRGATRGVVAGAGGVRYLTVHAARGPLRIGTKPDG